MTDSEPEKLPDVPSQPTHSPKKFLAPIPEKPGLRKLTPKEKRLIRAKIENPEATLTELGKIAEYKTNVGAWKALQRESVKESMRMILNSRKSLRLESLAKTLEDGLIAMDTKLSPTGEIVDLGPDHNSRHKYLTTALKLHGLDAVESQAQGSPLTQINIALQSRQIVDD